MPKTVTRVAAILGLATSGCIWQPPSGTQQENTAPVYLLGYTYGAHQTVNLRARNYVTGGLVSVGSATSGGTETYAGSGLYPWTATIAHPERELWAPPELGIVSASSGSPPVDRSIGRLEIHGDQGGTPLYTFTTMAQNEVLADMDAGVSQRDAGQARSDGTQVLLYDNSGVNVTPEANAFTSVITVPLGTTPPVQVSVVHYQSDGFDVLGLVCEPMDTVPGTRHPLVLFNHGGADGNSEDQARFCKTTAMRGFIYAIPAYRAEPLRTDPAWPLGASLWTPPAGPVVETSLGEVKDALRMLDIMRLRSNVDTAHVLMAGHSHGGSITLRAVEQGAPVTGVAVLAAATDWAQIWDDCRCTKPSAGASCTACVASVPCIPGGAACNQCVVDTDGTCTTLPASMTTSFGGTPTTAPLSYSWRSPYAFIDDLKLRRDVKFFVGQGLADVTVRYTQACKLVKAAWGDSVHAWHVPTGSVDHNLGQVADCGFTWQDVPRPGLTGWAQQTIMVYDGAGHLLSPKMVTDFTNFIDHGGW